MPATAVAAATGGETSNTNATWTVTAYAIDRASAWDTRWSDHAPVVVDYAI